MQPFFNSDKAITEYYILKLSMKQGDNRKQDWIHMMLKVSKRQQIAILHYNVYNILKKKNIKIFSPYILYTTKLFFSKDCSSLTSRRQVKWAQEQVHCLARRKDCQVTLENI